MLLLYFYFVFIFFILIYREKRDIERLKPYRSNTRFLEWLDEEVESTLTSATIDDKCEFAFGSIEEALESFEEEIE